MISDSALYRRRDSLLFWAVALSVLIHALGFVLYGAFRGYLPAWLHPPNRPAQIIMLSSSTRIEHRSVPERAQPRHRGVRAPQSARPVAPRPQVRPRRQVAAAAPAYHELAQPAPSATPMPQPQRSAAPAAQTFAQRLAREQAAFTREVAQLRRQDNPLSIATIPPRPASAYRRAYVNTSGINGKQISAVDVVTPIRNWIGDGLDCYYVHYDVQFSTGAAESGEMPWPLCFSPQHNALSPTLPVGSEIPTQDLLPRADYVLPSGTYLSPFLRWLYNQRAAQ